MFLPALLRLMGWLTVFCIFGLITKHVAESKGYEGGFWWGFWLGIIGLLVVGLRPNRTTNAPMYGGALQGVNSSNATWTCVCGAQNRTGLNYCPVCRRTLQEAGGGRDVRCPHCGAMNNAKRELCVICNKPLSGSTAPKSMESVEVLEKLVKLREQGFLTEEEFNKKKTELLSKL